MYAWSYGSHTSHTDMRVEVHFAYIRRWASFDGFNGRKTKLNKKASSKDKEKRKHFFLKNQILPNSHQRNKRTNFRPPKPKPDVTQFYTAGTLCTEIEKQKTKGRERKTKDVPAPSNVFGPLSSYRKSHSLHVHSFVALSKKKRSHHVVVCVWLLLSNWWLVCITTFLVVACIEQSELFWWRRGMRIEVECRMIEVVGWWLERTEAFFCP